MSLLIDGYNLLHIAGFLPRGVGPGSLERSRHALLNFVAQAVEPSELVRTTVVFDAKNPPAGLPKTYSYSGITVWFSADFEDADELIEQLILQDSAPRSLTVVSSDHRLQRAARRRRAVPVDSDRWFQDVVARRRMEERVQEARDALSKPAVPSSPEEVRRWMELFGIIDPQAISREIVDEASSGPRGFDERTRSAKTAADREKSSVGGNEEIRDEEKIAFSDSPFPPGYGEDLLRELDDEESEGDEETV